MFRSNLPKPVLTNDLFTELDVTRMSVKQKTNRLKCLRSLLMDEMQRVYNVEVENILEFTEESVFSMTNAEIADCMNTMGDLLEVLEVLEDL